MDVVWGETAGVKGQLWVLYPLLFILQVSFCVVLSPRYTARVKSLEEQCRFHPTAMNVNTSTCCIYGLHNDLGQSCCLDNFQESMAR